MSTILDKILRDQNFTELIKGTGFVLFFKILGMVAGYFFNYLITHLLGTESYGIYAICFTLLSIAVVISKLGLDNALVKSISAFLKEDAPGSALLYFRKSFTIVTISSALVCSILYFSSGWLAQLFGNRLLEDGIKVVALIVLPNSLLHIQAEKYRGLKKMGSYSLLINGSITLIAAGLLLILHKIIGNITELSLLALGSSISLLLILVSFRSEFKVNAPSWNFITYHSIFKLSIPMLLSGSMFLVMSWTDILLLGYYLDETQVAIYSIAFKISTVITIALYAVNAIASPKFSELHASNQNIELKALAMKIAKLNLFLTLPIIVIIAIFSPIILAFFGEDYLAGQSVLLILCAGQFFSSICGSVLTLLNMAGKEKIVRNIVGATALLNIGLNALLINLYGIEGAAISLCNILQSKFHHEKS